MKTTKKTKLEQGRKVEMEHTDSPTIAEMIAEDHLSESKDYYDKLEIAEEHSLPQLKRLLKGACRERK